jgi:hypothetical protein
MYRNESRKQAIPNHGELDLAFISRCSVSQARGCADWDAEPARDAVTGSHLQLSVRLQHDFAEHPAFAQHLVRAADLLEQQPLGNEGLDFALFEQVQQR